MQDRVKIAPCSGTLANRLPCRSASSSSSASVAVKQKISAFEDPTSTNGGGKKLKKGETSTESAALKENALTQCQQSNKDRSYTDDEGGSLKNMMDRGGTQSNNFLHDNDFTFIDDDDPQSIDGDGIGNLDCSGSCSSPVEDGKDVLLGSEAGAGPLQNSNSGNFVTKAVINYKRVELSSDDRDSAQDKVAATTNGDTRSLTAGSAKTVMVKRSPGSPVVVNCDSGTVMEVAKLAPGLNHDRDACTQWGNGPPRPMTMTTTPGSDALLGRAAVAVTAKTLRQLPQSPVGGEEDDDGQEIHTATESATNNNVGKGNDSFDSTVTTGEYII